MRRKRQCTKTYCPVEFPIYHASEWDEFDTTFPRKRRAAEPKGKPLRCDQLGKTSVHDYFALFLPKMDFVVEF